MKWAVLLVLAGCSSVRPEPTPQKPISVCVITCPWGYQYRPQHICRNGQRWFQDALATDRHVTRGADGGILSNVFVTKQGDYPASDVEYGTCSTVIASIVAGRSGAERGRHPGEDGLGRAEPPK